MNKYQMPESLKFKGNFTRLGAKTSYCLRLCELFEASSRGFTDHQWAHVSRCKDCIIAYSNYMKLRRAEARDKLKLSMDYVPLPDMNRLK